jgi:hypothetical protein
MYYISFDEDFLPLVSIIEPKGDKLFFALNDSLMVSSFLEKCIGANKDYLFKVNGSDETFEFEGPREQRLEFRLFQSGTYKQFIPLLSNQETNEKEEKKKSRGELVQDT